MAEKTIILATTETQVRWYKFRYDTSLQAGQFELLDSLDLDQVPQFGDRKTALQAAQALGLKTWRYVQI